LESGESVGGMGTMGGGGAVQVHVPGEPGLSRGGAFDVLGLDM